MTKAPDLNVLIEEMKDFDYYDMEKSFYKLKRLLCYRGYDVSTLEKALFGEENYFQSKRK